MVVAVGTGPLCGQERLADELPRIPPLEPAAALSSIEVLPGFRVELAAAEPLVRDPVALDFDEQGRLYVVEMCDYSEQDSEFLGTVRRLEDTNGDGQFDRSTVFADGLSWPTAVICFDGGVFVGAAPDIYYLKDTDGDGRADQKRTVFTGFGRSNVQGLLNSFRWGLNSRIHGATSSSGGVVTRPDAPQFPAVNLQGQDFSFDPRRLDLRVESGGGQHGMCFDDWGRKFVCSNSDHLQMVMFESRYAVRNPLAPMTVARVSIAGDGPQAKVYRKSPVEPWRIVRTRMRAAGLAPGVLEGGGQPAGYFTGATGVTIYRGDAFPPEFIGQAFVGDVGSNLIHRKVLEPDGVSLVGRRVDAECEFVASRDIWFRPAQFANAPDGALYIADVYREVIEHPASIPPEIKRHLDLTSGRDRGRIYRVVPQDFRRRPLPQLQDATVAELVTLLEHRNGWHRDTAARLLYERQDPAAVAPLRKLAAESRLAEGRVHALYALAAQEALTPETVLVALADDHPRVREHAVRLAEPFADDAKDVRLQMLKLGDDDDSRVRLQLAFSLGELRHEDRIAVLVELARRDVNDRWMPAAIFSSLSRDASKVLIRLASDKSFHSEPAAGEFLDHLAEQVGRGATQHEIEQVETSLPALWDVDPSVASAVLCGLVRGIGKRSDADGHKLELSSDSAALLEDVVTLSAKVATDSAQTVEARLAAIAVLSLGKLDDLKVCFAELLASHQPVALQLAAVDQMRGRKDVCAAELLIAAWPGMSPRVRTRAADVLLSRLEWMKLLWSAVERGEIAVAELDIPRLRDMAGHRDPEISQLAARFTSGTQTATRQEVLERYQATLALTGDSKRGKETFKATCAACHRVDNVGYEIGPSLAAMKSRGPEAILLNVLDPHREVNPQFVSYVVMTTDGRSISGLITGETAAGITITRAENLTDTIARDEIDAMWSTGQSLMPEGLENEIDLQAMADLLAYLMSVE